MQTPLVDQIHRNRRHRQLFYGIPMLVLIASLTHIVVNGIVPLF